MRGAHGAVTGAKTYTGLCPLSALEIGTGSSTSCPGVAIVPQAQQEPYLPRQPKPLPSNLIPPRVHDLSIPQAREGSPSQRRATLPSQATPAMLQRGPGGQATGCSPSTHPHGAVGRDRRVNTKNQLSSWARRWHRGSESCCMPPPAPDRESNTINIPSPSSWEVLKPIWADRKVWVWIFTLLPVCLDLCPSRLT